MIKITGELSRRQAIAGAVTFSAAVIMHPADLRADTGEISHTAESIHQETLYKASPKRVFDALTDARQFDSITHIGTGMDISALGNKPTAISREEGGSFTLFGGHIFGRQLELVHNERIVQAWRVVDWSPGIYSIARFELVARGTETRIVFDHTGFPQGKGEHLAEGWKSHYWEPLEKFLAGVSN